MSEATQPQHILNQHINLITEDGLQYLDIQHPKAQAKISLFGAHLLDFTPSQQDPLIWLSNTAIFDGKRAIRGGVPVCWPWFGPADDKKLPSHGFARNSLWTLAHYQADEDSCTIQLSLSDSSQTRAVWPFKFQLTAEFIINEEITINLITENTDSQVMPYGGALHSYLNISDTSAITITGVIANDIVIKEEVDQAFDVFSEQIIIKDQQAEREIQITNEGNNAVVVWNPWREKARAFADMPDDGYKTMLCIEPAIIKPAISIEPGNKHTLSTTIAVLAKL